ncbi:MAG: serine/threonine-protein kinase [Minicystis sp.]
MLPLPTYLGPYRLLQPLGQGGMAIVYAAVHERMEREVALKILSAAAAADPQLAARFVQEARALARLTHPGVVRVVTADTLPDGTTYLVMERLDGPSLRAWMDQHSGPISSAAALPIARQLAGAMVAVHAEGIVHRDLKPDNVVLTATPSGAPHATIIDFGIAKVPPINGETPFDTRVQTVAPAFLGTFTYAAPEQCRNAAAVTDRADVYALGVILFEMLAGRPPFVAAEPIEILSMHVKDDPPALQDLAPAVPAGLAAFVASMLAKDPAARPTMSRCRDVLQRPWEDERDACPFPGISPFTEAHAELFFGRAAEADQILAALAEARAGARRWIQLEGPGGAGKTSLVQAGVLPRLPLASAPDEASWILARLRPADAPVQAFARALSAALQLDIPPDDLERLLRTEPAALADLVTNRTPPGACVLLVIEPTEELFTLGAAERGRIDALLTAALATPGCPLRLLTTLRTDFLHHVERMEGLGRLLAQAVRHKLGPLPAGTLTAAVHAMAQRAGLRLSEGLAERMVRDAAGEGSRLPFLGHALARLWSSSRGAPLTHERYEQLGGVSGALAQQADLLLDSLGDEGRARARWILLDLVHLGRGVADTCRPRTREQVIVAAGGDGLAEDVLLRLSGMHAEGSGVEQGSRLVVLSREAEPSFQRVDLVHEALLREVPRIAGWIRAGAPAPGAARRSGGRRGRVGAGRVPRGGAALRLPAAPLPRSRRRRATLPDPRSPVQPARAPLPRRRARAGAAAPADLAGSRRCAPGDGRCDRRQRVLRLARAATRRGQPSAGGKRRRAGGLGRRLGARPDALHARGAPPHARRDPGEPADDSHAGA